MFVAAKGVIQQPRSWGRGGCIEAPAVVGAADRLRRPAGFRTATASATRRIFSMRHGACSQPARTARTGASGQVCESHRMGPRGGPEAHLCFAR